MPEITAIFCDVGGVILTNGWDVNSRIRAASRFELDWDDFEIRHGAVINDLEKGNLTLDEYLTRTVFNRQRTFTMEDFKAFIFAESKLLPETSDVIFGLSRSKKRLLATLNNESLELNLYRIRKFGLLDYFTVFFSSCFLGVSKPDPGIYRLALQITQRSPSESLFIDDRAENIEAAKQIGMHTIHCQSATQLRRQLEEIGILEPQLR